MKLFSHWFAITILVMWSYYIMVIKEMEGVGHFVFVLDYLVMVRVKRR